MKDPIKQKQIKLYQVKESYSYLEKKKKKRELQLAFVKKDLKSWAN